MSDYHHLEISVDVKKESDSGMFTNYRLLFIKSGFISYYSKKPQDYVGKHSSVFRECSLFGAIRLITKTQYKCI